MKNHRFIRWKTEVQLLFQEPHYVISLITGACLMIIAIVVCMQANGYATAHEGSPVSDLILNAVPVWRVYWLYVFAPVIFWVIALGIGMLNLRSLPFVLKSLALFVVIRSMFVSLTHLGVPADMLMHQGARIPDFIHDLNFSGDLFFSGHTGLPFLLALIFWRQIKLRIYFLAASVFFGAIVLLGHYHYSIDVIGAFFITYSIFAIAQHLFKSDFDRFSRSRNTVSSLE